MKSNTSLRSSSPSKRIQRDYIGFQIVSDTDNSPNKSFVSKLGLKLESVC